MTRAGRSTHRARRLITVAKVAGAVLACLACAAGTTYLLAVIATPQQLGANAALPPTSSRDAAAAMTALAKGGFRHA